MNDQTLNCFIKDKPESEQTSKTPSSNKEFLEKLHHVEKTKKNGDLYYNLKNACESLYSLCEEEKISDETLNFLFRLSYDTLFCNIYTLRAYNKKLYSPYGIYCKEDISSSLLKDYNESVVNGFEKLFNSLYEYIDSFKFLKDSDMYLWILRDENPDTYQKLCQHSIRNIVLLTPENDPFYAFSQQYAMQPDYVSFPIYTNQRYYIPYTAALYSPSRIAPPYHDEQDNAEQNHEEQEQTEASSKETQHLSLYYILKPAALCCPQTPKPVMISSCSFSVMYGVINGNAVIYYNNDLYELNVDTLKSLFSLKSKSYDILRKYINCLKKEIESICINLPIKDTDNNRPFFNYIYAGNEQYCLKSDQGTVFIDVQYTNAFFKPIIMPKTVIMEKIRNGYVPQELCRSLQVISNNKYYIINCFAKLFADCLLPYPLSKKLYVINAKDDHDIDIIKGFIKRILSYGNGDEMSTCVIDKNKSINDVCKSYAQLNELKYTRIYALFMKRGKKELDEQMNIYLSNLLKNTSNNPKNCIANNIQPILFQTMGNISDIQTNLVEYIDISNSVLDERINTLSIEDCCWTRLIFSLYGLHLILEKQKSRNDFDLGCNLTTPKPTDSDVSTPPELRQEYLTIITNEFIQNYFVVTEEEIEARKKERSQMIKKIKSQYKNLPDPEKNEILKKELAQIPLFVTSALDLKKYIKVYLDTQCKSSLIAKHKIDVDDIYSIISNKFEYASVHILYTQTTISRAFKNLSLKEIWPVTKGKMEQSNVNVGDEPIIESIIEPPKASFDDPCDENLLDFLKKLNSVVRL